MGVMVMCQHTFGLLVYIQTHALKKNYKIIVYNIIYNNSSRIDNRHCQLDCGLRQSQRSNPGHFWGFRNPLRMHFQVPKRGRVRAKEDTWSPQQFFLWLWSQHQGIFCTFSIYLSPENGDTNYILIIFFNGTNLLGTFVCKSVSTNNEIIIIRIRLLPINEVCLGVRPLVERTWTNQNVDLSYLQTKYKRRKTKYKHD